MGRKKNPKSEKILIEFKKLKRRASTRTKIYKDLANKFRVTEAYVRLLVSRAGLTSREHSLMYAFSVEEEEALANVCIACASGETVHYSRLYCDCEYFQRKN